MKSFILPIAFVLAQEAFSGAGASEAERAAAVKKVFVALGQQQDGVPIAELLT